MGAACNEAPPPADFMSGPEGDRTPYLLTASQTLYQVSYGPRSRTAYSLIARWRLAVSVTPGG